MHPSWLPKRNKYNNKKTVGAKNILFDSKKEANRYSELLLLERGGLISNLKRQVKYVLIPSQTEIINNKKTVVEREISYIADFVYFDESDKKTVVEDVKGLKTKEYILKRKLMLWIHKIKIKEI